MMTILLWRCPICQKNDALAYRVQWRKPDSIRCTNCKTAWEVTRVAGEDFRLKVIEGAETIRGWEMPLAKWYAKIKSEFQLEPIMGSSLPLLAGEELYLREPGVPLIVRPSNPLLRAWREREAPLGPFKDELIPIWRTIGPGSLCLTSRRFIWTSDERVCDFPLGRVYALFTYFVQHFGIMYGMTAYRFKTPKQSVLKWLTYAGHAGAQFERETGHKMRVSHF